MKDLIERQMVSYKLTDLVNEFEEILSHIRESEGSDYVCVLCEYDADGAYIGQSGDWCNECPGFDKDDCFKLNDKYKKEWLECMNTLPSVQPRKGKWIYGEHDVAMCDGYRCDKCGFFVPWDYQHKFIDFIKDYNYCPSCGADMRGDSND